MSGALDCCAPPEAHRVVRQICLAHMVLFLVLVCFHGQCAAHFMLDIDYLFFNESARPPIFPLSLWVSIARDSGGPKIARQAMSAVAERDALF